MRCFRLSLITSLIAVCLLADKVTAEPEGASASTISISAGLGAHFDDRTDGTIPLKLHVQTSELVSARFGFEAQCDSHWACALLGFYSVGFELGTQLGQLRPYVLVDASFFMSGTHFIDDNDVGRYNVGLFLTAGLGASVTVTDWLSVYAEGAVISSTDREYVVPRVAAGLRFSL